AADLDGRGLPADNPTVRASTVAASSPTASPLARALEQQRARAGRMLARVRLAGVGTILTLVLAVAYGGGQADWRGMVPGFAAYAVGAALLALAVRRSD